MARFEFIGSEGGLRPGIGPFSRDRSAAREYESEFLVFPPLRARGAFIAQ